MAGFLQWQRMPMLHLLHPLVKDAATREEEEELPGPGTCSVSRPKTNKGRCAVD